MAPPSSSPPTSLSSYPFQIIQLQVLSINGLEQIKPRPGQVLELKVDLAGTGDSLQTQRLVLPVQQNVNQWIVQQQPRMQFLLPDLTAQCLQNGKLRLRLQWNPLWSSWLGKVAERLTTGASENFDFNQEPSQERTTNEREDEMSRANILLASLSPGMGKKRYVQLDSLKLQLQLKWLARPPDQVSPKSEPLDYSPLLTGLTIAQNKSRLKKKGEEKADDGDKKVKELTKTINTIEAGDRQTMPTVATNTMTASHEQANLLNLQLSELRNLLYPKLAHCLENENLPLEAQTPVDDRCVCVYVHSKSVRPPTSAQTTYQSQHARLLNQLDRPPVREYTQRLTDSLIQKSLKNGRLCLLQPRKRLQRLGEQSEWRFALSVWLERKAGASYEWMNRLSSAEMQRMQLITLRNCLNQRKVMKQRQELNQRIAQEVRQRLRQIRKQMEKRNLKQRSPKDVVKTKEARENVEETHLSTDQEQRTPSPSFGGWTLENEQIHKLTQQPDQSRWMNRKRTEVHGKSPTVKDLKRGDKDIRAYVEMDDGETDDQAIDQLDMGASGWHHGERMITKSKKNWYCRMWVAMDMRVLLKPFGWAAKALYEAFIDTYSRGVLRVEVGSRGDRIDAPPPPNAPYSELGARSVTAALKQLNWAHTRGPFLYGRVEE